MSSGDDAATDPLDGVGDELEIQPASGPLDASVRPPGSKSITNRALVCAALANVLVLYSFWAVCGLTLAGLNVVKSELSRSSEGTRTLTVVQAPQGSA